MNAINLFRGEEDASVYVPGDTIFKSGEHGEHMYVVLKGKVDIKIGDQVVETVQPGGIFGELALIDDEERSADAVAQTEAELAMVDKERFTFLVQNHPFFALYVLKLLAERLRRYSRKTIHKQPALSPAPFSPSHPFGRYTHALDAPPNPLYFPARRYKIPGWWNW